MTRTGKHLKSHFQGLHTGNSSDFYIRTILLVSQSVSCGVVWCFGIGVSVHGRGGAGSASGSISGPHCVPHLKGCLVLFEARSISVRWTHPDPVSDLTG